MARQTETDRNEDAKDVFERNTNLSHQRVAKHAS